MRFKEPRVNMCAIDATVFFLTVILLNGITVFSSLTLYYASINITFKGVFYFTKQPPSNKNTRANRLSIWKHKSTSRKRTEIEPTYFTFPFLSFSFCSRCHAFVWVTLEAWATFCRHVCDLCLSLMRRGVPDFLRWFGGRASPRGNAATPISDAPTRHVRSSRSHHHSLRFFRGFAQRAKACQAGKLPSRWSRAGADLYNPWPNGLPN